MDVSEVVSRRAHGLKVGYSIIQGCKRVISSVSTLSNHTGLIGTRLDTLPDHAGILDTVHSAMWSGMLTKVSLSFA